MCRRVKKLFLFRLQASGHGQVLGAPQKAALQTEPATPAAALLPVNIQSVSFSLLHSCFYEK